MITLTKFDGTKFVLNADLIETIEEHPDTTIRLTTKAYYLVSESSVEVVEKVVKYKNECNTIHVIKDIEGEGV